VGEELLGLPRLERSQLGSVVQNDREHPQTVPARSGPAGRP
jgi:hypothetical protein